MELPEEFKQYSNDEIKTMLMLGRKMYESISIPIGIGKPMLPVSRGQIGEQTIYELLQEYFPSAIVTNTTKESHMGDFIAQFELSNGQQIKILIECKYVQKITIADVKKFEDDCERNYVQAGILLSATDSAIPGKLPGRYYMLEGGVHTLYVTNFNEYRYSVKIAVESLLYILNSAAVQETKYKQDKLNTLLLEAELCADKLDKIHILSSPMLLKQKVAQFRDEYRIKCNPCELITQFITINKKNPLRADLLEMGISDTIIKDNGGVRALINKATLT